MEDSEELLSEERIQLRSVEDYINQRNRDAVQAIADVQSAKQSKEHQASNLSNVDMQIDELSSRDSSLVEELAGLGESRISLGTERENIVVELDNLKIESEEITERRNEVKAMQQARELDAAKSQARSQALRDNFDQLESQISRIESSLARKREEYALAEEEIEEALRSLSNKVFKKLKHTYMKKMQLTKS